MMAKQKNRSAFTIIEALTGIILLAILLSAVYIFLSGHILQSRHLEGYLDLQRDTRLAILRVQKDLKGLIQITSAARGPNERLEKLEFLIPVENDVQAPVKYEFDVEKKGIRRNSDLIISETIKDMQLWLLDEEGRDVFDMNDYTLVQAVRLRVTVTTPPKSGKNRPGVPGDVEEFSARGRSLDFTIYPRLPVSIRKSRQGKLNLTTGRFATRGNHGSRTGVQLNSFDE